jgi:hypothetical protein
LAICRKTSTIDKPCFAKNIRSPECVMMHCLDSILARLN